MGILKDNFEPTDFADADCRVTRWYEFPGSGEVTGYRIWLCKCGEGYWFQRHEWTQKGKNSTIIDGWIFSGYSPRKNWDDHFVKLNDVF